MTSCLHVVRARHIHRKLHSKIRNKKNFAHQHTALVTLKSVYDPSKHQRFSTFLLYAVTITLGRFHEHASHRDGYSSRLHTSRFESGWLALSVCLTAFGESIIWPGRWDTTCIHLASTPQYLKKCWCPLPWRLGVSCRCCCSRCRDNASKPKRSVTVECYLINFCRKRSSVAHRDPWRISTMERFTMRPLSKLVCLPKLDGCPLRFAYTSSSVEELHIVGGTIYQITTTAITKQTKR